MFLRLKTYHRPRDLAEALGLLAIPRTRLLAGGTAVVGPVDGETESLVDLSGLGLHYIRPAGPAVAVGAMATLADLTAHPPLGQAGSGVLKQAILHTGPTPLLNRATVGGALARPARAPELVAALLALDARVLTLRTGPGGSAVREGWELQHYLHHRPEILRGAVVEEVQVPVAPAAAALERVARTPRDPATVAVVAALQLADGRCRDARVAAVGLSFQPKRLEGVEAALGDLPLTDVAIARAAERADAMAYPPDDLRGSAEYRRHIARILVRRALQQAYAIGERSWKEA